MAWRTLWILTAKWGGVPQGASWDSFPSWVWKRTDAGSLFSTGLPSTLCDFFWIGNLVAVPNLWSATENPGESRQTLHFFFFFLRNASGLLHLSWLTAASSCGYRTKLHQPHVGSSMSLWLKLLANIRSHFCACDQGHTHTLFASSANKLWIFPECILFILTVLYITHTPAFYLFVFVLLTQLLIN